MKKLNELAAKSIKDDFLFDTFLFADSADSAVRFTYVIFTKSFVVAKNNITFFKKTT